MLHAIAYLSTASWTFDEAMLRRLLMDAKAFNRQASVTGVLLYRDRNFFQYFEGPEVGVAAVYKRIVESSGHHRISEVLNADIQEREFPDWHMGFRTYPTDRMLEMSQLSWRHRQSQLEESVRVKSDGILFLHSFIRACQGAGSEDAPSH